MIPEEITTLEEATDAFLNGCDKESDGQFDQSDVAALACIEKNRLAWGMSDDDILKHIGTQSDRSRTTMYGRLLVGRVFNRKWRTENDWCLTKRWSHFEVCARMWSEGDPDAPYEWLKYAVDNDLSVRRLKLEIQSANGEGPQITRPIYVLDAEPCDLDTFTPDHMTVKFQREIVIPNLEPGMRIVVTAVIEPDPIPLPFS
jgi:hypothetical protein